MVNFSIVIPNLNGQEFLTNCLNSLNIAISKCPGSKFEIIMVDNDSQDDSVNIFSTYTDNSIVLPLSHNVGFAKAVNLGIKKAKYEYVVVCNNDLTVDQFWFKKIKKTIMDFPKAACFCGTVLNNDIIESQGIEFDFSGKCIQINHGANYLKTDNLELKTISVWGSSAALVVYQKKVLKKLKYFREIYFAYLEDVDLAFRLHQKKFKTIINPACICQHLGGGTSSTFPHFRQFYIFRNWFIFIFLNYEPITIVKYFPKIFLERLHNLSYLLKSFIK